MTPLPVFDLHYPDGLALVDLVEHIDLDCTTQLASGRTEALVAKLTRAAADVARLKQGWRPPQRILAEAPVLSSWSFVGSFTPGGTSLSGIVIGHPTIRSGSFCTTSVLLAIDTRSWTWARTVSRFYRLRSRGDSQCALSDA